MKNAKICKVMMDIASRSSMKCQCCGNGLKVGEEHVKSCTPKRSTGYHLHTKCATNISAPWARSYNTESDYDAITCKNHRAIVYSSIYDAMYFCGENAMHGKKLNKTTARYKTDYKKNRQSVGAILSTCYKKGCRVFIQFDDNDKLIEVFSKEEYTELTNINK